jgi:hypothetical protein
MASGNLRPWHASLLSVGAANACFFGLPPPVHTDGSINAYVMKTTHGDFLTSARAR